MTTNPKLTPAQAHTFLCNITDAHDLLSRLLMGEADNQSPRGKLAVAWVVMNRARIGGWFGRGFTGSAGVILKPWQFSCFNEENNPSLPRLVAAEPSTECKTVAALALGGHTADPTGGATYYYAPKSMKPPGSHPRWESEKVFLIQIDDQRFYRDKRKGE